MENDAEDIEGMTCIMEPKSLAVIGASSRAHTVGSDIVKKILAYKYTGKLYLINIKGGVIEGINSYKSILDIDDKIDLAILVVNAKFILAEIDKCHEKGVKGLIIIASGFKETLTENGEKAEEEIKKKCKNYAMRLIGPNCLGVINTDPKFSMDACFAETLPESGEIGFASQSGALGGGILNILRDLNVGFSQFISIGNQTDIDSEKVIKYWENYSRVKQILLYMENIPNPKEFLKVAQRVSKKKPIIALKSGATEAGAKAAMSHTGSLAGVDKAIDALMRQGGVIREYSLKDMFNDAKAFSFCNIPNGDRVAVVTNSGGPGIMCTDSIIQNGMQLAKLTSETEEKLKKFLPSQASVKNPVDMIASAPLEHYSNAVEIVAQDENVDMIIVIYLPFLELKDTDVAKALIEVKKNFSNKPIVGVFMTESPFFIKVKELNSNIPFYLYTDEAVKSLAKLNQQRKWLLRPEGEVKKFPLSEVCKENIDEIFNKVRKENRTILTTDESLEILGNFGIIIAKQRFVSNEKELEEKAKEVGFPLVMKISSKTITHKNDVGGIVTNILNEDQLKKEYSQMMKNLEEKKLTEGLEGVLLQEQVNGQKELAIGVSFDSNIGGHLIMFGIGGIFIEIINDVSFRIAPITDQDANDMIKEIKCYKFLEETRGTHKANIEQIKEYICLINDLITKYEFIKELDINPLLIHEKTGDVVAVDCRIKIE